jgi:hypothetical protein
MDVTGVFPSLRNVTIVPEDRSVVEAGCAIRVLVLHNRVVRQSGNAFHLSALELRDLTDERDRAFIGHVRNIVPRWNSLFILGPGDLLQTIRSFCELIFSSIQMLLKVLASVFFVEEHLVFNSIMLTDGLDVLLDNLRVSEISLSAMLVDRHDRTSSTFRFFFWLVFILLLYTGRRSLNKVDELLVESSLLRDHFRVFFPEFSIFRVGSRKLLSEDSVILHQRADEFLLLVEAILEDGVFRLLHL